MIRRRQLTVNTLAAAAQVVVTGVAYFFLYRFVFDQIGIERFGVWSVVLITATISSLANLGLGSSTVKFVSMYLARKDEERAALVVQTALITLALVLTVVLSALYPAALWALSLHSKLRVAPALLAEAYAILPYAFASFWSISLAGISLGAIDGHQRVDLRSVIHVCATGVYLIAAMVLVPRYGLPGLAWAHLMQGAGLLLTSWVVACRLMRTLPLLPVRWRLNVLREVLHYSLNAQTLAVFWLLFEPLTRWLVSVFGGLAAAGWFEFANRMAFQLRALIASAHQAIVPAIADLVERQASLLSSVYRSSFRVVLFLVLVTLPVLVVSTPLVSRLWIGAVEPVFVTFASLLFTGWFVNLLSNPAYFAYMGIGTLRWNVIGRIVIGVLNGILGWSMGVLWGGTGVIAGFVIALVIGSLVTAAAYHREYRIAASSLIERQSLWLALTGGVGFGAIWPVIMHHGAVLWIAVAAPVTLLAALAILAWHHNARRTLQQWVQDLRDST